MPQFRHKPQHKVVRKVQALTRPKKTYAKWEGRNPTYDKYVARARRTKGSSVRKALADRAKGLRKSLKRP